MDVQSSLRSEHPVLCHLLTPTAFRTLIHRLPYLNTNELVTMPSVIFTLVYRQSQKGFEVCQSHLAASGATTAKIVGAIPPAFTLLDGDL
jgi:hypothetical protein